ncbi:hypothetical protein GCM10007940_06130 [Portibacter lacus]|uniref:histidine kinase n=2 Tax=Portibacter lacus TaxID=1099794 RepID=A0AA37SK39_9BACT|nr:hypothetical protein GCM10007940_06130 [Portibacter lacus]
MLLLVVLPVIVLGQYQPTKIDIEMPVYAVLPTVEGPVYYIQKNDDVIYNALESFAKLKVYDGHNLIDLGSLGRWVDVNEKVTMDRLQDGSIFITFTYFNLEYLYHPRLDKLEAFTSPLTSGNIYSIGVVEGAFYYSIRKDEGFQIIRYNENKHEFVCDSKYFVSQIIKGDDSFLFLEAELNDDDVSYINKRWHEVDLNCGEMNRVVGLRNLEIENENIDLEITELTQVNGRSTFRFGPDSTAIYEWDINTDSISALASDLPKAYLQRSTDVSGNSAELYKHEGKIKLDLTLLDHEKISYETNFNSSQVRSLKFGNSPDQLWVASKEGLFRLDRENPSVTRILGDESFRNINIINKEEVFLISSTGRSFVRDRDGNTLREITDRGNSASDNRFLKRDLKGRLLFDGSWHVYAIQNDYSLDTVAHQGGNYYAQLLDSDDLFISSAHAGNFIKSLKIESHDTIFLSTEIDRVLDCTNLDVHTIAMASNKGFTVYDIKGEQFIFQDTIKKKALSLLKDDQSNIYVGYEDGTMRHYNASQGRFELVKEWSINPGYGIAKILPTTGNRLWISTFSGVCIFNTFSTEFYFLDNALFSNPECNRYSSFYDSVYQKVYIGTVEGLYIFDETISKDSTHRSELFFVEKSYPVLDSDSIRTEYILCEQSTEIVLPAHKRNFSLSFSTKSSPYRADIQFEHRLNGGHWQENGANNELRFNYLKSGKNVIEIRAIEKKTESNIIFATVQVNPFFYESWWFRLGSLLLIFGGSLWWFRRLRSQNKRLEAAVTERTAELRNEREIIKQQADELESLDKLKNQFFANISHELRTPLTLLISPIEGISEGSNLTDQQRSLLRIMKDNGKLLQSRVSELLELSRLTSKKVVLRSQKINLKQLIHSSTQIFEPLAERKNIDLIIHTINLSHSIIGDEIRISKIIQNLIINAIKFTNEGGRITCNFKVEDEVLHMEISDSGIGIKEENLDKIFNRFYQVQSINELANPGTGIGLSMVKEYVELMNGSIKVNSEYQQGSNFLVTLPIEITDLSEKSVAALTIPALQPSLHVWANTLKPKLLIVEDNEDLRKYIRLVLEAYFMVEEAEDGEIAWSLLQKDASIDIILSDIMMPKMNGISLLNEVRQDATLQIKPFVFLTAKHNEADLMSAYRMGVDDYLKKPFSEKELIYRLNAVYQNYKARVAYKHVEQQLTIAKDSPEIIESDFIRKLNQTILEHIQSNEFGLDLLAEKLQTSKRTLIRVVKKEIGITPNKYIIEVKLNKARQLYETGKCENLEEVIAHVGISTPWYFRKLYLERFGVEWGQSIDI